MDKIREIAVLKLIGTRNRTIAAMIMQQALLRAWETEPERVIDARTTP